MRFFKIPLSPKANNNAFKFNAANLNFEYLLEKIINKIRLQGQEAKRVSWRPIRMKEELSVTGICSF